MIADTAQSFPTCQSNILKNNYHKNKKKMTNSETIHDVSLNSGYDIHAHIK